MSAIFSGLAFFSGQDMWIVLVIVLVLFGGAKIPTLMRGIGRGVGELQEGLKEGKKNFESAMNSKDDEDEAPKSTAHQDAKS